MQKKKNRIFFGYSKSRVIPSYGYADQPPPLTLALKKSHLHLMVQIVAAHCSETNEILIFRLLYFWDITVPKWEKLYPFCYINEKDAQCYETYCWDFFMRFLVFQIWFILYFTFVMHSGYTTNSDIFKIWKMNSAQFTVNYKIDHIWKTKNRTKKNSWTQKSISEYYVSFSFL